MILICEECKENFQAPPSQKARYCGRVCYDKSREGSFVCKNCAKTFKHYRSRQRKFCSDKCQREFMKGVNHYKWRGGRIKQNGYVLVYSPEHPNSKRGYIREHRLVMEQSLNRLLDITELVHHKNGNKEDNRLSNLEIISRPAHTKLHNPRLGTGKS